MPFDLQSAQVAVAIAIGLLTILGTIFGWFGKLALGINFVKVKTACWDN